MISTSGTVDANVQGGNGLLMALNGESVITLYVFQATGAHNQHELCLEISPESSGSNWIPLPHSTRGEHPLTEIVAAQRVRVCVSKAEGEASTVNAHMVAV